MVRHTLHRREWNAERAWDGPVSNNGVSGESVFAGHAVRLEVPQSRTRSLRALELSHSSALADDDCLPARWNNSPLRRPIDELAADLQEIADAGFVVGITDESGALLWICGGACAACRVGARRVMRRRSERVNFLPGGRWSESASGTYALALAQETRLADSVSSAEHLVESLDDWVCYSAPIRDPEGNALGVLDFATTCDRASPLAMTTVRTMATLLETRLRELQSAGADQGLSANVALRCLGRIEVTVDDESLQVSPRQAEILALLALRPDGYTPGELSLELYGDRQVSMSTLKGEVSRVRRMLRGGIAAHRYMLTTPVRCDAVEVLQHLTAGDVLAAVDGYRGPLLPNSEAPGVVNWRDRLEVAIREAALRSSDPKSAMILGERIDNDPELHEHALNLLSADDPRVPLIRGRLHVLRRDWD